MQKKKILVVFGTRPEAIKMCPVIRELKKYEGLECRVCLTGQHRSMVGETLDLFGVSPDHDLAIMREGQDLFDITEEALMGLRRVMAEEQPHLVLVHGDTTSAFAAALAAFYLRIPVSHVEAGLRTYDLSSPFPEEWNRRAIDILAAQHFAPTVRAKANLLGEGIPESRITVTGNTVIDALAYTVRESYTHPDLEWAAGKRLILLTLHRRENLGEPMRRALRAIRRVAQEFADVRILCPMHPNPAVRTVLREELEGCDGVRLREPLDVFDFHNILARSYLVLTDSGGIQEEAAALNKPLLVLRHTTERPEGLEAGCMRLIGTGEGSVYRGFSELLINPALYHAMAIAPNPYGNGTASVTIARAVEKRLTKTIADQEIS